MILDSYILSAAVEFFAALVMALLLLGCLTEQRRSDILDRLFISILITNSLLLLSDVLVCLLLHTPLPDRVPLVKFLTLLVDSFMNGMMILYTYFLTYYISQKKPVSHWYARSMSVVCAATVLFEIICLFNDSYIGYDASGAEYEGSLFFLVQLIGCAMLAGNILYPMLHAKALGWKNTIILSVYGILPLVSMLAERYWPNTPPLLATTLSIVLVYVIIHMQLSHRSEQQALRLAKQEAELSDSRMSIMLSQIQPHFLYNALSTIRELCKTSPELAEQATIGFSDFLRGNMVSLTMDKPISFEMELEHTKNYLMLEKLRFKERLNVSYDVQATDFRMPPLTLQPIVENAVRYGVTKRENGGTVMISTKSTENASIITITDDGVGFDPYEKKEDGRTHIGIANVQERLKQMVNGTLQITSTRGVGTPKENMMYSARTLENTS